jgi:DNA-binding MarR family transcriptional regulator
MTAQAELKEKTLSGILSVLPSLMHALFHDYEGTGLDLPINRTQAKVLMIVEKLQGATMTHLSHMAGLEKGSFTAVADRLIAAGFVERGRDPQDRRKIILLLTEEGRFVAHKIIAKVESHIDKKISQLNKTQRVELVNALEVLSKSAEILKKLPAKT